MSSVKHTHAAREIQRLRAALATAEKERDAAHNDALERAAAYCERTIMGTPYRNSKPVYGGYIPDTAPDDFEGMHPGQGYAVALRSFKKETPNADK